MAITEFGRTLRHWRDRVPPETVGLSIGDRRRTPGLRREELALLAGISVDYVTRLEQGRSTNPSAQVVEALGRALRLSRPERDHFFCAAGLVAPGRGTVPTYVTPSIHRMLDRLTGTPVAVADATWTLLLVNPLYVALMGEQVGKELNSVWRNFLGSSGRARYTPPSRRALEVTQVAELRATVSRYPSDQRLREWIAELCANSERFSELWDAGSPGRHDASRKTIDHPDLGPITLDCDILTVVGSDLRILIYTAEPGTEAAGRLEALAARTLPGPLAADAFSSPSRANGIRGS